MCNETGIVRSDEDSKPQLQDSEPADKVELVVGSYEMVTEGLSIRRIEDDDFDAMEFLARADAVIPEATTIADAINQYDYALLKFPEGKNYSDLIPRKTAGFEGYYHPSAYNENGGVGGGNVAVKQAGLQPAAIANLAMQSAAFALGMAYMARIDTKLDAICTGIHSIRMCLEEDYIGSLEGNADSLLDYAQNYDVYITSQRESIRDEAEGILRDLNKCWRKELSRMSSLRNDMRSRVRGVKQSDAEEFLYRYSGINDRACLILELAFLARQVRLYYNGDFSSRRIEIDREAIDRMRRQYHSSQEGIRDEFRAIALALKIPIGDAVIRGADKSVKVAKPIAGAAAAGARSPIALGILAALGVASTTLFISTEIRQEEINQKRKFLADVTSTGSDVGEIAEALIGRLGMIDFEYNVANGLLIDRYGMHPVEIGEKPIEGPEGNSTQDEDGQQDV